MQTPSPQPSLNTLFPLEKRPFNIGRIDKDAVDIDSETQATDSAEQQNAANLTDADQVASLCGCLRSL